MLVGDFAYYKPMFNLSFSLENSDTNSGQEYQINTRLLKCITEYNQSFFFYDSFRVQEKRNLIMHLKDS